MVAINGTPLGLSAEQLAFFNDNGYLIIPDELSADTVSSLLSETRDMLANFSLDNHPMTRFTTGEAGADAHVGDAYFLTSGDKIRFFFESDAFGSDGALRKPKEVAINKIGHYLHELSAPFKAVSLSERNAAIATSLGFADPRVLQSMVICKQSEIGGAVPPHQDSTFLFTEPPSAVGFWYALEDATLHNGCLAFAPGTHRTAPVESRFVRSEAGGTEFVENVGSAFPRGGERREGGGDGVEYVLGPVKAGSLVVIHGNVLHKSEKNTSDRSRFICRLPHETVIAVDVGRHISHHRRRERV